MAHLGGIARLIPKHRIHLDQYQIEGAAEMELAGYAAGQPCPEGINVPAQNARVEAILARGGARVQEALYRLADDSSQESSGDEWLPVKRVTRSQRRH